jgi:hypothetical protein
MDRQNPGYEVRTKVQGLEAESKGLGSLCECDVESSSSLAFATLSGLWRFEDEKRVMIRQKRDSLLEIELARFIRAIAICKMIAIISTSIY